VDNEIQRGKPKIRQGVVQSNKMDKTVVVAVDRLVKHPKYKKYLKQRTRFKAHDEQNQCAVGDQVEIIECRRLSRDKRWRVRSVLKKAV
jgi:small subunit ribosomal protein S17